MPYNILCSAGSPLYPSRLLKCAILGLIKGCVALGGPLGRKGQRATDKNVAQRACASTHMRLNQWEPAQAHMHTCMHTNFFYPIRMLYKSNPNTLLIKTITIGSSRFQAVFKQQWDSKFLTTAKSCPRWLSGLEDLSGKLKFIIAFFHEYIFCGASNSVGHRVGQTISSKVVTKVWQM